MSREKYQNFVKIKEQYIMRCKWDIVLVQSEYYIEYYNNMADGHKATCFLYNFFPFSV